MDQTASVTFHGSYLLKGSIVGRVSIEGMGIDGVSVSLSNGASTATAGGGCYRFDNVEQGSYTVTISGFPADASFDRTSADVTIGNDGETVTADFRGVYIRTGAILGAVTVENLPLAGMPSAMQARPADEHPHHGRQTPTHPRQRACAQVASRDDRRTRKGLAT